MLSNAFGYDQVFHLPIERSCFFCNICNENIFNICVNNIIHVVLISNMNKLNIIYSINCNVADLVMQTFIKIEITISYMLTKN